MTRAPTGTVIAADQGASYWQPVPANGHVTVKVSPAVWDGPFSLGVQVVAPGGHIRLHAHDRNHEVVFVWEGEGTALVDGTPHPMRPGTVIVLPRDVEHSFLNDGAGELRLLWIMAPHGLEDFFARIGRVREPGAPAPAPFPRPADVLQIEADTVFRSAGLAPALSHPENHAGPGRHQGGGEGHDAQS